MAKKPGKGGKPPPIVCRACGGSGYQTVARRRVVKGKTITDYPSERCKTCGGSGRL